MPARVEQAWYLRICSSPRPSETDACRSIADRWFAKRLHAADCHSTSYARAAGKVWSGLGWLRGRPGRVGRGSWGKPPPTNKF
jgi:hypothetical protein